MSEFIVHELKIALFRNKIESNPIQAHWAIQIPMQSWIEYAQF